MILNKNRAASGFYRSSASRGYPPESDFRWIPLPERGPAQVVLQKEGPGAM